MESSNSQVIHKRRSFLSTLALGLSGIVVMLILSLAAIFVYAMNIADRKSDSLLGFAEQVVRQVPQLREWLPPVLNDAISDERSVSYQKELEVTIRVAPGRRGTSEIQPVIEVTNRGDRVVSFLSMRIVVLDANGVPLAEANEWAVTPISGDRSWRGPLFPGSKRTFLAGSFYLRDRRGLIFDPDAPDGFQLQGVRGEVEITELRLWNPDQPRSQRMSATVLRSPPVLRGRVKPAIGDLILVENEAAAADSSESAEALPSEAPQAQKALPPPPTSAASKPTAAAAEEPNEGSPARRKAL